MNKIKINCGDHIIELTPEELRSAYEYKDREYLVEDIESELDGIELADGAEQKLKSQIDDIAWLAQHYLEISDYWWDIYWENIRSAIKAYLKEDT